MVRLSAGIVFCSNWYDGIFKILKRYVWHFEKYVKPTYVAIITPFIFWLISFGLYLGRYLRFNSWNVVNHPFQLMRQSFDILFEKDTIAFTFIFSIFLAFL